jgi:hypothetical protein
MGCLKKKKTPSELSDGRSTYLFFTLLGDGHPSYSFPQVPIYVCEYGNWPMSMSKGSIQNKDQKT